MADARTQQLVEPATQIVMATHVNPMDDMVQERGRSTIDVQQLLYAMNGGKEKVEQRWVVLDAKELMQS